MDQFGVVRLPPGFRFHPTDEELVVQYLKRKVYSFPLPASIIPDLDVSSSDPWDLPGDWQQERFFFSRREVERKRSTLSGYWKATGLDKQIVNKQALCVGMKKTLVFYKGRQRTGWMMHEYRLPQPNNSNPQVTCKINHSSIHHTCYNGMVTQAMDKWVVCRIFVNKRGRKNKEQGEKTIEHSNPIIFYDFMTTSSKSKRKRDLPLLSSGSSGITTDDADQQEQEEENSHPVSTFRRKE